MDIWFPVAVALGLTIVTVFGISGSSLGTWSESGSPDESALLEGRPLPIRSDEWLVSSPMKLGQVRAGFPSDRTLGMGEIDARRVWRSQIPSRSLGGALYAPFNLPLVLLPLRQGFALYWWLPFAWAAVGLYGWLRLMRVEPAVALAAGLLATTAPAAVWWSNWSILPVALATAPCALLVLAARLDLRRGPALLLGAATGLAAAALPWTYQPFAIPVAVFMGTVTLLWVSATSERRRRFIVPAVTGAVVLGIASLAFYLHERTYYLALAHTAYPGARRSIGGSVPVSRLFSSLFPFALSSPLGKALRWGNLSEISMGWTAAAAVSLGGVLVSRPALRGDPDRSVIYGTAGITLFLASWCRLRWPGPLAQLTLMSFSPPERTAPFVGFFGVVLLALLLGTGARRRALSAQLHSRYRTLVLTASVLSAIVIGGSRFRSSVLPEIPLWHMVLAVGVVGALCVALLTRWSVVVLGMATVLTVWSAATVNPLMRGVGKMYSSPAAALVRRIDQDVVEPQRARWAADGMLVSGLLNGQGVNSLSSYNDPVSTAGWRIIDPVERYKPLWNRLGYIVFEWTPGLPEPVVQVPNNDIVKVAIDPCDVKLTQLRLKVLVATQPTSGRCLVEVASAQWQGQQLRFYRRDTPDQGER